jgi:hypothetical protein
MVYELVFIIAIFPSNYITDTFEIRASLSITQGAMVLLVSSKLARICGIGNGNLFKKHCQNISLLVQSAWICTT